MNNKIGDLNIVRGETGFIVMEDSGEGLLCKKWAFTDISEVAEFVLVWGKANNREKVD